MNTNLKKLAKGKSGRNVFLNVLLGLTIVLCLIGLVGELAGGSDSSAEPYTLESKEGDRAYVDAQYMSEHFAVFESKESDKLYFILDKDLGHILYAFRTARPQNTVICRHIPLVRPRWNRR